MVDQKFESELREVIEAFYFAYREFTAGPDKVLARRGLNRVHHRILYFIGRQPGIGVSELLETLKVSKQALHAPLRQLVEMGLVQREAAPEDRRAKQLNLTRTGRLLEAQLTGIQMTLLQGAFDEVGGKSRERWLAVSRAISRG